MIYFGFFLGACCIAAFSFISNSNHAGLLSKTALNPYLFLILYSVVVQADFLNFYLTGHGILAQARVNARDAIVAEALVKHNVVLLGLAFGSMLGGSWGAKTRPPETRLTNEKISLVLLITVSGFLLAPVVVQLIAGSSALTIGVESHSGSHDPVRFLFSMLLLPALIFFLIQRKFLTATLACLLLGFLLLGTGSRTRVLYVIIPYIFYLLYYQRIRIPKYWFALMAGAAILLAIAAVNYRILTKREGFEGVGWTEVLGVSDVVNSNDVPFAEAGVLLLIRNADVTPFPLEGFVGAVLAPIPRAIAPFKPEPGSVQFTIAYDDRQYYWYERSLVIGGITELIGDYVLIFSAFLSFFFSFSWSFFVRKFGSSANSDGFAVSIILYIVLYAFLRNDLQSVGQVASTFLVVRFFLSRKALPHRGKRRIPIPSTS